jgi:hypothetical protein
MVFLILCFVAVAIPYGVERLYFVKTFGPFAALFWLFVFQCSVIFGGNIILANQLGQSLPGWVKSIGLAIAFLSFMAISITPLVAVLSALVAMVVVATERHQRKSGESPD